jgi:FixJ family two-component response regulator
MGSPPPIIHIVDDDETFRRAVVRLVEASGFRSASYESGDDLLAHPPGDEAGCILLDLQMPGMNGLDLQDRLTEAAPLLPIIFLTGYGDIQATVRAMKAGAEDFLEKTASSEALLQAIGRAMVRYQGRLA